ncbi:hypothetical protein TNCV_963991 [Trichonephila clavipes]|nr:hypothetical protein TNCV_963991 [Trichonephila clavipes]
MRSACDQSTFPIDVQVFHCKVRDPHVEAWRVGCHLNCPPRHSTEVPNHTVYERTVRYTVLLANNIPVMLAKSVCDLCPLLREFPNAVYKLVGEVKNIVRSHNYIGKHGWKVIGGAVHEFTRSENVVSSFQTWTIIRTIYLRPSQRKVDVLLFSCM